MSNNSNDKDGNCCGHRCGGLTLRLGAVYGLLGVALGAFGAHALRERLAAAGMLGVWETAVLYQLVHAVALVGLAAAIHSCLVSSRRGRLVTTCWGLGVLFFAGSLYLLALGAGKFWGPITPLGGLLMMVGWLALILPDRGRCAGRDTP